MHVSMMLDDATDWKERQRIRVRADWKGGQFAWLFFDDGRGAVTITLSREQLAALVDQINHLDWSAIENAPAIQSPGEAPQATPSGTQGEE